MIMIMNILMVTNKTITLTLIAMIIVYNSDRNDNNDHNGNIDQIDDIDNNDDDKQWQNRQC